MFLLGALVWIGDRTEISVGIGAICVSSKFGLGAGLVEVLEAKVSKIINGRVDITVFGPLDTFTERTTRLDVQFAMWPNEKLSSENKVPPSLEACFRVISVAMGLGITKATEVMVLMAANLIMAVLDYLILY